MVKLNPKLLKLQEALILNNSAAAKAN